MKPLPPEVSLGQLLDLIQGKKPKPVPRFSFKNPLNKWWILQKQRVRHFPLNDPKAFERMWSDLLAATPRDTKAFLARMREIERRAEDRRKVAQKRSAGRAKHLKRLERKTR